MPEANTEIRIEGGLPKSMARRTGSTQHQDHAGHGKTQLPDTGHGDQGNLGLLARLQSDSADDGASCGALGLAATPTELQAHGADMDRVDGAR